jgi:hypothetical protein
MGGGPEFMNFLEQQLGQQGGFGAGRFLPSGFQGQQGGRPGGFQGQSVVPGGFQGQGLMPWDYQIPQAPPTITPPVGQFAAPPLAAPAQPAIPGQQEQGILNRLDPGR